MGNLMPQNANAFLKFATTVSEEEPPNNEAYPFHTLATRTPFTVEFDNHDSGKRVWFKVIGKMLGEYLVDFQKLNRLLYRK